MERQPKLFDTNARGRLARRLKADIVKRAKLPTTLKAVVVALADYCGEKRFCWPSLKALALRLGHAWPSSRSALQKKLRDLAARRLITIEPDRRPDDSQTSNKYRILWGNLKRCCDDQTPTAAAKTRRPPASNETPPRVYPDAPPRPPGRPPASARTPLELPKNHQPKTTTPIERAPRCEPAAAALLKDFGIERIEDCLKAAARAGTSTEKLAALIDVAKSAGMRRDEWRITPGMLFDRIRTDAPTKPPATAWHPDAMELLKRVARPAAPRPSTPEPANLAEILDRRNRLAELEAKHGAHLDGLTADEFAKLAAAAGLNIFQLRAANRDRRAPLARPDLLRYLERLAATTEPAAPVESTR